MNWGNKLILAFVVFILFIGYMVYQAFNTQFDLVSKNYYNDELRYQDKLQAIKNANAISDVEIIQNNQFVEIHLPNEIKNSKISGYVLLYCKTDEKKDFKTDLQNNQITQIEKAKLKSKYYTLQLTWVADTTHYYFEKNIEIHP